MNKPINKLKVFSVQKRLEIESQCMQILINDLNKYKYVKEKSVMEKCIQEIGTKAEKRVYGYVSNKIDKDPIQLLINDCSLSSPPLNYIIENAKNGKYNKNTYY